MCHVLIIEDEPLIALNIQMMLEDIGATSFDLVATEFDAVRSAIAHPPHLITSDVTSLEGTGPGAVVSIHEHLGVIPVIFITATPSDCQPCTSPSIILTKPITAGQLTRAFRQTLQ